MALTSFASGALVTTQGWTLLNLGSLLPVALTGLALLWLARCAVPAPAAALTAGPKPAAAKTSGMRAMTSATAAVRRWA